ncbi:unnamed protein product, partial [Polarella glacialis]
KQFRYFWLGLFGRVGLHPSCGRGLLCSAIGDGHTVWLSALRALPVAPTGAAAAASPPSPRLSCEQILQHDCHRWDVLARQEQVYESVLARR